MGSKNKLKRFKENETFSNVIQPERSTLLAEEFAFRGNWRDTHFKNQAPIVLELGCGKGEYAVGLAQRNPDKNFIGVDIKGARFWRGAKTAIAEELNNVAFLRAQIELIDLCFAPGEVDEIWITFPDPQIKFKRRKHRLTHPAFLNRYKKILNPEGIIHLKTDSEFLHGYTLGLLEQQGKILYSNHHIYKNHGAPQQVTEIKTFYEQMFLEVEKPITYLQFQW
ncbi:tRNA (guanosine(46)-N7)-methyltransferase TrmB [Flavobacteriaceae bacterium]|nr:tRNA (guanosine(46)-N7)-methyltransferase TrmB [Flavobacteriaceae bacterium]MDA7710902.1 tRNA (guanosine(46)-N7)-methyltransferase TrmB [Flavobacteriaceae bacterium]MDA8900571.1 tRNA (guanosine(46)-N7)-methyltransferase TrmB [Flavobacteriaceae bacterium]MDB4306615.1 tRNA (guanosine(46)-N7)-methyltransferase TrmB [Flavobacteriaceae bacterium]